MPILPNSPIPSQVQGISLPHLFYNQTPPYFSHALVPDIFFHQKNAIQKNSFQMEHLWCLCNHFSNWLSRKNFKVQLTFLVRTCMLSGLFILSKSLLGQHLLHPLIPLKMSTSLIKQPKGLHHEIHGLNINSQCQFQSTFKYLFPPNWSATSLALWFWSLLLFLSN